MWRDLGSALALMFVLEGILPFLNPRGTRQALLEITRMDDRMVRLIGLSSMLIGLVVLYLIR